MKKLILILLGLSFNASVWANEVLLSERTVALSVDISTTKIKRSRADYSSPVVKVLVPDLAAVTILDHRNTGEGAPCMATYDTMSPEDVIQNNPAVEQVDFNIKLIKTAIKDELAGTCTVSLNEEITAKIRGFNFTHSKAILVGNRHIDDCK